MANLRFLELFVLIFSICESHRLPSSIVPISYNVTIKTDEAFFHTNRFTGEVIIKFKLLKEEENLQIHWKTLSLVKIDLKTEFETFQTKSTEFNFLNGSLKIWFNKNLPAETFQLTILYTGVLKTNMKGFYKNTYVNTKGVVYNSAATEFEPDNARTTFPCFDEPALRAIFTLSLEHSDIYRSWSNTPVAQEEHSNNTKKVTFKSTPLMSTYLLAFVIGNFTCDEAAPYRICSREETQNSRQYALSLVPKYVKYMESFTGISYSSLGVDKLDLFAIPEFSVGAMENWGINIYREPAVLWNKNCNIFTKGKVAATVAHETAHAWFGNYVAIKWWSYLFLKEGFATYFEMFANVEVENEWQFDKRFNDLVLHYALEADSEESSPALASEVVTSEEINSKYDAISYEKAACIFRMVSFVLGKEQFQAALQHYLKSNNLGSTAPEDLWSSFEKFSPKTFNFTAFINTWTVQAGYPVLDVVLKNNVIIIRQERFLLSGKSDSKWDIPLTFTTSRDNNFGSTSTQLWYRHDQNTQSLRNVLKNERDWIVFNNQQIGYYRVKYDDDLWERIYNALKKNMSTIHELNRAHIVDDLFNFEEASLISYPNLVKRLDFLSEDTNFFPWKAAFMSFQQIVLSINKDTLRKRYFKYVDKLMSKFFDSIESPYKSIVPKRDLFSTLKLQLGVKWACIVERNDCLTFAKESLVKYKQDTNSVNVELLPTLLCTAIGHLDNVEEEWNALYEEYIKLESCCTNQATPILMALTCVRNETVLMNFLERILFRNDFQNRDCKMLFDLIASQPNAGNVILSYILKHFNDVVNGCPFTNSCIRKLLDSTSIAFKDRSQVEKMKARVQKEKLTETTRKCLEDIIKNAADNVRYVEKLEKRLQEYFDSVKSRGSSTLNNTFEVVLAIILIATCIF